MCKFLYDFSLMIGGAIIGFLISEVKSLSDERRKRKRTRDILIKYVDSYEVTPKGNEDPLLLTVDIGIDADNELTIKFHTRYNGTAIGKIRFYEHDLTSGTAHYNHIDEGKEHLSGTYYLFFIEPGLIHATKAYVSERSEEKKYVYILKKI
jgi:hypothetical protein